MGGTVEGSNKGCPRALAAASKSLCMPMLDGVVDIARADFTTKDLSW